MEENDQHEYIEVPRIRQKKGVNTIRISASLPEWLIKVIDEEAKEKNKTRSQVMAYLLYSGLKAHIGNFAYPNENSIHKNYLRRGKTWIMK